MTRWKIVVAAVILLLAGGVMSDLDEVVASPNSAPGEAVIREATVLATPAPSATHVSVELEEGGAPLRLRFQAPYVPIAGDKVNVLFAAPGASMKGIVLGGLSGQSGNRVLNGDFHVVNPAAGQGAPPPNWIHYRASGATTSTVTGSLQSPHETPVMVMALTDNAASDNYAYSAAIPVKAGDSYRLDAVGRVEAVTPSLTIELRALWFADDKTLYPSTVAGDSLADSLPFGAGGVNFGLGNDTVTVPAGATHMRVAIRVLGDAGAAGNYLVHIFSVQGYRN